MPSVEIGLDDQHYALSSQAPIKSVATLARCLQADPQVELRKTERAAAIGTRDAGRGRKTELRRQAAERPNPRQSLRS